MCQRSMWNTLYSWLTVPRCVRGQCETLLMTHSATMCQRSMWNTLYSWLTVPRCVHRSMWNTLYSWLTVPRCVRGQCETLSTHDSQCHDVSEVMWSTLYSWLTVPRCVRGQCETLSTHDSQCHDVFIQIIGHWFGFSINLLQRGPNLIHPRPQLFAHCGCIACPHWWKVVRAKRAGADLFHRCHSQGLHQVLVREKIAPQIVIKSSNRTASVWIHVSSSYNVW